jgi:predicted nucleic acid-binding protein
MPGRPPVVVDTNIIFSALLSSQSRFTEVLLRVDDQFYANELTMVELFKHKEKIVRLSRLSEDEIIRLYYLLLRRISLYKEDLISPENRRAAYALCGDIDETDTPHLALTLELDGLLWTGDSTLKKRLKQKGFDRFHNPSEGSR